MICSGICFHFVAFLVFFLPLKDSRGFTYRFVARVSWAGLSCCNCFLEGCGVVKSGYARIFILTMAYQLPLML